jgi:hypothetical protein
VKQVVVKIMLESGWSSKRREVVIAPKKATNERKKRHAAEQSRKLGRDVTPCLVNEDTATKFVSPMGNHKASANAKCDFHALMSGRGLPAIPRPTNISMTKVDTFMEWMTEACQFRPEKLRNCYWKRDKQTTKNMPVYVRHGSLQSNLKAYCEFFEGTNRESLRIGQKSFAKLLSSCTLQGTYNQGLSNYYTDFLEAIKVIDDLLH